MLWRHRVLVVSLTGLSALVGFTLAAVQPKTYASTARLVLKDPRSTTVLFEENRQPGTDPARFTRGRAQYMTSTAVLQRAAASLDGRLTVEQLRGVVSAEAAKDADLVTVTVKDATPRGAAQVGNAVVAGYRAVVGEELRAKAEANAAELRATAQATRQRIDQLQADLESQLPGNVDDGYSAQRAAAVTQLLTFQGRSDQVLLDASLYGDGVQLAEPATLGRPASARPVASGLVAGLLGFLLACGIAWLLSTRRGRADERHDAATALGAPLLGEVPEFRSNGISSPLPVRDAAGSPVADAYQLLATSLRSRLGDAEHSAIVVTGVSPAAGATTTAVNLAAAGCRSGRRVVVVDADQRSRGLTALSGVSPAPGLAELADDSVPVTYGTASMPVSASAQLPLVPAGGPVEDPAAFLRSRPLHGAVTRLRGSAEQVILDAPPVLAASDATVLAGIADGVVLVVRAGTPLRRLAEVRDRLDLSGVPLLGYVFTRTGSRWAGSGLVRRARTGTHAPARPLDAALPSRDTAKV